MKRHIVILLVLLLAFMPGVFGSFASPEPQRGDLQMLIQIQARYEHEIIARPGVLGMGIGLGDDGRELQFLVLVDKDAIMVAENFAKLDKVSSLVVNGHHRVPPHPATWSVSSPLRTRAAGLPTISLKFSTLLAESRKAKSFREMVAHWLRRERLGLKATNINGSFAVRLLPTSLTCRTPRSRIVKEQSVDRLQPSTEDGWSQWLVEIHKSAKKIKKARD